MTWFPTQDRPDWHWNAACLNADVKVFFPYTNHDDAAFTYCRRCDVQTDCLEDALTRPGGDFGIRGGTSERERRRIIKERRRRLAVSA